MLNQDQECENDFISSTIMAYSNDVKNHFSDEDNLFIHLKSEDEDLMNLNLPSDLKLMIKKINNFDWLNNPFKYEVMLLEFQSDLKYYLEDMMEEKISYMQKQYLIGFTNYLYEEYFKEFD